MIRAVLRLKRPLAGRRLLLPTVSRGLEAAIKHTDDDRLNVAGFSTTSKPKEERSIADVFNVAKVTEKAKTQVSDFDQYMDLFRENIETNPKFLRKHTAKPIQDDVAGPVVAYLTSPDAVVDCKLPILDAALKGVSSDSNFVDEVIQQRQRFLEATGFSKKQYQLLQSTIRQVGSLCAKYGKGAPASVLWSKVREAGVADKSVLHNLLYVASTFLTENRTKVARFAKLSGSPLLAVLNDAQGREDDEDIVDCTDEVAVYHDLLHEPTEQTMVVRVRLLVAQGLGKEAERILDEHAGDLHLRAYAPVLALYIEQGDMSASLALYTRMLEMPAVIMDVDTHINMITALAEHGFFRSQGMPLEGAMALGYKAERGTDLFDQLLEGMSRTFFEIPEIIGTRLRRSIDKGLLGMDVGHDTSNIPFLPLVTEPDENTRHAVCRVKIDPKTGLCPATGIRLRLIKLADADIKAFKQHIFEIARQNQHENEKVQERRKGRSPGQPSMKADEILMKFVDFLNTRSGEPYTVIVDGPNVGYHMQNFDDGRFSYHQIMLVVEALKELGENPIVLMPNAYTQNRFYSTVGARRSQQRLSEEEVSIRDSLVKSNILFRVPPGHLDDYFWMIASIADQTVSKGKSKLDVPPCDASGRWPGTRPMIISNDEMRDHKLALVDPILFRRWYSNCIVVCDVLYSLRRPLNSQKSELYLRGTDRCYKESAASYRFFLR